MVMASSDVLTSPGRRTLADSGRSLADSAGDSQRPSRVMASGTTSYFSRSIASMTERAERIETSCSPERPP